MEETIEVRYAGVVVGRTTSVRGLDAHGAFIGLPEPLPVGTIVTLKLAEGSKEARVEEVVESADPNAVGMRVGFDLGAKTSNSTSNVSPSPPNESASASVDSAPGAQPEALEADEGSGAISAPLSLAGPEGNGQGGGKKKRKRR
ncbi:MAG TPA: hypothetical protein VHJ20_24670 [Polyangia bacterium]|nr:hypothetical protein [Polyangia bacterium]